MSASVPPPSIGLCLVEITVHSHDLPAEVDLGACVAIDTETTGLKPHRDRLCSVQLSSGDGSAHIVRIAHDPHPAPNLIRLFGDEAVLKLFHFARFDLAMLSHHLHVATAPVFCTKIASRLVRTYTDRHGLKDLCRELLGVNLSKQEQSTDWAQDELTKAQIKYAASDVLYLHALHKKLSFMLEREQRSDLAEACFKFLPDRVRLDLMGWEEVDIFAHSS